MAETAPIDIQNVWKPPEYERRLPELIEKARAGRQDFKVWKGDRPRCEIEGLAPRDPDRGPFP